MKIVRNTVTGAVAAYPGHLDAACRAACGRCDQDCRNCELVIEDGEIPGETRSFTEIEKTYALLGMLSPQDMERLFTVARLADRYRRCVDELPEDCGACEEWGQALDDALGVA